MRTIHNLRKKIKAMNWPLIITFGGLIAAMVGFGCLMSYLGQHHKIMGAF